MSAQRLASLCPLLAGLDAAALASFDAILEPVSFPPGAALVRQGQAADSAFVIESGTAEVVTALPGGGEARIAEVGPGAVIGEMALLEGGVRSASVIARTALSACVIEREGFRLLLAQRNRAACTVQQRITRELCRRLRELDAKVVASEEPRAAAPARAVVAPLRRGQCSFDYRAFLPVLPLFQRFLPHEVQALAARAQILEIERGQLLFGQGEESRACYLVVRGALELFGARGDGERRIGILGPGRLCGVLALIEGRAHSMGALAREHATLLEIAQPAFEQLFFGEERLAAKFREAVNRELLQALARTNNSLTRLISQACIRGARAQRRGAEELQRALAGQDCRVAA
jgi:CRP-like cAMP-binding protein